MSWSPAFRRGYHYYDEKRKKRRALAKGVLDDLRLGGQPVTLTAQRITLKD